MTGAGGRGASLLSIGALVVKCAMLAVTAGLAGAKAVLRVREVGGRGRRRVGRALRYVLLTTQRPEDKKGQQGRKGLQEEF